MLALPIAFHLTSSPYDYRIASTEYLAFAPNIIPNSAYDATAHVIVSTPLTPVLREPASAMVIVDMCELYDSGMYLACTNCT